MIFINCKYTPVFRAMEEDIHDEDDFSDSCDSALLQYKHCNLARQKIMHLPGDSSKYITQVSCILSPAECSSLELVLDQKKEVCDTSHMHVKAAKFAAELFARIKRYVPETYNKRTLTGIHPNITINEHTTKEQSFPAFEVRLCVEQDGNPTGEVSVFTVVVFLNSASVEDGSCIRMYEKDNHENYIDFERKLGSVLIYDQTIQTSLTPIKDTSTSDVVANIMYKP